MTTKLKKMGVASVVFILGIVALICLVIRERNIYDIGYLILLVIYFIRFIFLKMKH